MKQENENPKIIDDAGMKIGGAKKDLYGKNRNNFSNMTHIEISEMAKKSKIWRESNKEIFEGKRFEDFDFFWLLMQKEFKKSIPNEVEILDPFSSQNEILHEILLESRKKYKQQAEQIYIYFIEQIKEIKTKEDFFKQSSDVIQNMISFYHQDESDFYKKTNEELEGGAATLKALNYIRPSFFIKNGGNEKEDDDILKEAKDNYAAFRPIMGKKITIGKNPIEYLFNNKKLAYDTLIYLQEYLYKKINFDTEFCLKHNVYNYELFTKEIAKKFKEIEKNDNRWVFSKEFAYFIDHLNKDEKFQNTIFLILNNRLNINDVNEIRKYEKEKGYITLNFNEIENNRINKENQNSDNINKTDENESKKIEEILKENLDNKGFTYEDFEKRKNKFNKEIINSITHLSHLKRKGPDWRNGRDVTSEDFIKEFGFRAVEYGESLPQKERQIIINFAYDSFCDLAYVLNTNRKMLSLNPERAKENQNGQEIGLEKSLALAFGARGRGSALAHFETGRNVINLTRLKGAGSLVHEYGHALEFLKNNQIGVIKNGEEYFAKNTVNDLFYHLKYYKNEEKNKDMIIHSYQNSARKKYDEVVKTNISFFEQPMGMTLKELKEFQSEALKIIHPIIDNVLEKNKKQKDINIEFFTGGTHTSSFNKACEYVKNNSRWNIDGGRIKAEEIKDVLRKIDLFSKYKNLTPVNQKNFIFNMEIVLGKLFEIEFLEKAKQDHNIDFGELIYNRVVPKTAFFENALDLDNRNENNYWSSYTEMGARAFEDYINKKMKELNIENNFLINLDSKKKTIYDINLYNQELQLKEVITYPSEKESEIFYPYFEKYVKAYFKHDVSMDKQNVEKNFNFIETNLSLSLTKEKKVIKDNGIKNEKEIEENVQSQSIENKIDHQIETKRKRGRPKKEQPEQMGFNF